MTLLKYVKQMVVDVNTHVALQLYIWGKLKIFYLTIIL